MKVPTVSPDKPVPLAWSAMVGAGALIAYLLLTLPVLGDKDTSELALVLATNGVTHPTGYPLFTMLGHLFAVIVHALGAGWAFSANAWSAVGGALAVGLLHRFAINLIPAATGLSRRTRFLMALVPAVLFGANPIWTYECTLTEVYSWHQAWVAGAALLALRLSRTAAAAPDRSPVSPRAAIAWGLLCGAGMAHHVTAAIFAGPLTLALLWILARKRMLRLSTLGVTVTAGIVPLLSYGMIAWRAFHPATYQWGPLQPSWQGVWYHITGGAYHYLLGRWNPSPDQKQFFAWYVHPILWPALALLVVAWAARVRELGRQAFLTALLAATLIQTMVFFHYGVADPSSYFHPPMGVGLMAMPAVLCLPLAGGRRARPVGRVALGLFTLATLALLVPWTRTSVERRRGFIEQDRMLHDMWNAIPGDRGIVFWPDDAIYHLRGFQRFYREKPDVAVVHPLILTHPQPRAQFRQRFGFDPLEGVYQPNVREVDGPNGAKYTADEINAIIYHVNASTDLPVYLFDPSVPSVKLLKKPESVVAPPR